MRQYMSAELRDRWVAALRSGEFKQAKHTLLTPEGEMCCFGVLCKLEGIEVSAFRPLKRSEPMTGFTTDGTVNNRAYRTLAERFNDILAETDLALVNDDGMSFAQIADKIERVVATFD